PTGVPIVYIGNPANPEPETILNFANFRDDDGQGIAVKGSFVYLAAVLGSALQENGTTGNSRLYIGQYPPLNDGNVHLAISNRSFEIGSLPLGGGSGIGLYSN